ncbi:MAG TPA: thermonuclease family protein [Candidatus Nanoarchaeia archaeon]|nr:thermonuclease family protein [Candidatus Nanoarchaeia archaeon]
MKNKKEIISLSVMILLLIMINYSFLDKKLENFLVYDEQGFVERVIDGDTVIIDGKSTRLLGINTPERGEVYYKEAKEFLEGIVLNKTVFLKFGEEKTDRYGRNLAYIFLDEENVNLRVVDAGLANFYFPSGKDVYYDDFKSSWESCIEKNVNLCEKSKNKCGECVVLKNLDYKNDEIVLENICNFDCNLENWEIKDEGRKKFIFPKFSLNKKSDVKIIVGNQTNSEDVLYWRDESYVLTKTGDTLFLRDKEKKLVLWKSY